jgi:hypothetical protein
MPVDDGYTKLLLHMDGPDASTTFTDEAGNVMTAQGNAQIDTAQSVFGSASGLFDGTGDYVSTPDSIDWFLDDGSDANKWTADFRVRFNGDPGAGLAGFIQQRADNNNFWSLQQNNNNIEIQVRAAGTNIVLIQNAWNPAGNTWYHIAIVKNGTTGYLVFVDGTQIGTTQTDTSTMSDLAGELRIARWTDGTGSNRDLNGWMDEVRISKGIARWTANFTPPSAAYPSAVYNTRLLVVNHAVMRASIF